MTFRVIDDTIELDGVRVATILPSVWPTRRDYLEQSLEGYDPDGETALHEQIAELEDKLSYRDVDIQDKLDTIVDLREQIEALEEQLADAKRDNETLRDEKEELERQIDKLEALP